MQLNSNFSINDELFSLDKWKKDGYFWQHSTDTHWIEFSESVKEWLSEEEFVSIHTSGSTGTPKEILLSKKAMFQSARATAEFFQLGEKSQVLLCLSSRYIAGKMMVVRAMVNGWHLVVQPASSTPLQNQDSVFDFVAMVPMQVEHSLHEIEKCRKIIIGGAKLSDKLREQLLSKNVQAFETYGMTETATHIAIKSIDDTVFRSLPHVNISTDHRNCLVIANEFLPDGKITTNDVVDLIGDNSFHWKGRADFIINSGGVKINPEAVEDKLSKYIHRRFFVAGIPDELLGEKVVLIIEGDEYSISEDIFSDLSKYEKPKAVYFINQFLETDTHKILLKQTVETIVKG
ncbi:AMP-binding protein [Capnocytophaga sp. ARDL2]|uniref:AMP-binding protein n=1 Tax=Capnocytophaga sp. ARDL2 TaxID=3238809 RepID=UPI003556A23F